VATLSPIQYPKKQGSNSKAWLLILYLLVFAVGMISVYAVQNSQLQAAKHDLAAAQKKPEPISSTDIDPDAYQAVFLASGQTYFGRVESVDAKYLKLTSIYYLNDTSGSQNGLQKASATTSLVKLGCEIHAPQDKMVINMSQVSFWENLKGSGDVAKGIKAYVRAHPDGQCS
jgi:hypothetical protein